MKILLKCKWKQIKGICIIDMPNIEFSMREQEIDVYQITYYTK